MSFLIIATSLQMKVQFCKIQDFHDIVHYNVYDLTCKINKNLQFFAKHVFLVNKFCVKNVKNKNDIVAAYKKLMHWILLL
jgi:hypothetical protein